VSLKGRKCLQERNCLKASHTLSSVECVFKGWWGSIRIGCITDFPSLVGLSGGSGHGSFVIGDWNETHYQPTTLYLSETVTDEMRSQEFTPVGLP